MKRSVAVTAGLAVALALLSIPAQANSPRDRGRVAAIPPSGARAVAQAWAFASVTPRCRKARKRVKRATRRLRKLRRSTDERRIRKAKKRVRQARRKRKRACRKGSTQPSLPQTNRPPQLPDPLVDYNGTHFGFNHEEGELVSEIAHIVVNPATDPDGDPLTYSWSASQAPGARYETYMCSGADVYGRECSSSGPDPAATWVVYADSHGCIPEARAVVRVSDGRGGIAEGAIPFAVGTSC